MEHNRSERRRTTHYLPALSDRWTNNWEGFTAKAVYSTSSISKALSSDTLLLQRQNRFVACYGRLREVFLQRSMQTFCKVSMRGQKQPQPDTVVASLQRDCSSYTLLQLRQELSVGGNTELCTVWFTLDCSTGASPRQGGCMKLLKWHKYLRKIRYLCIYSLFLTRHYTHSALRWKTMELPELCWNPL